MTQSPTRLTYAIITPARNEAEHLQRLGDCLANQGLQPLAWIIVDNGSVDETGVAARALAKNHPWISLALAETRPGRTRAEPIVQAFHLGLAEIRAPVDVVVKLDADISMDPDYFERLLDEFGKDPTLGIASGSCYEEQSDGTWRQRHGTGSGVWGGCRGYRWACLQDVLPLEQRMGWDSMDLFKAHVLGWRTTTILSLPFRHHRSEGARDGTVAARWAAQGEAARYMGYRFSYLVLKTLYRALRHPAAVAILFGYIRSVIRREPVCPDKEMRAYVRRQQSARQVPSRIREALRPRERLQAGG